MAQLKTGTTIDSEIALHEGNHGNTGDPHSQYVVGNTAITGATHPKITYDSKGLVTSGEALIAGDIPNLDTSKITTGTFANTLISESSVTQHQAALSITESQISDFGSYLPLAGGTITGDLTVGDSLALPNLTGTDTAFFIGGTDSDNSPGFLSVDSNWATMYTRGSAGSQGFKVRGATGGGLVDLFRVSTNGSVMVSGALTVNGTATVEEPTEDSHAATKSYVDNFGVPTGSITMFGGTTAPDSWLLCNGDAVSRATYDSLFSVIGTTFGAGDGSTTFNLPDMRERFPVGVGAGHVLASTGGEASTTLTTAQLPSHNHASGTLSTGTQSTNHTHSGTTGNQSSAHSHSGTTGNQSSSHSHTSGSLSASGGAHQHAHAAQTTSSTSHSHQGGVGTIAQAITSPGPAATNAIQTTDSAHGHSFSGSTANQSSSHNHSFSTGNQSSSHNHSFSTGNQSAAHSHTVSGSTGDAGSGDTVENRPPYISLNFIIKA